MREATLVAEALTIDAEFPELRQNLRLKKDGRDMSDKERFRCHVFNLLIDSVIGGITERFRTMGGLYEKFPFLWTFREMADGDLSLSTTKLAIESTMKT